jgi:hypothetical protein
MCKRIQEAAAVLLLGLSLVCGCQRGTQQVVDYRVEPPKRQPLASPAGYEFASPVRLEAGGKFVSVEAPGYACPTVADVDGDGAEDLVVGQFAGGRLQFFKNLAPMNEPPRLAAAEWINSGEERVVVPGVS